MKKRFVIFLAVAAAAALAAAVAVIKSDNGAKIASTNIASGVSVIKEMENRDVAAVQEEIDKLAEAAAKEEEKANSPETAETKAAEDVELSEDEIKKLKFKQIFSDCAILGDSIAESISGYKFLDTSHAICKIGVSIPSAKDQLEKAQALNPDYVFLYYGSNDIGHDKYNYDRFREDYEGLLENAKEMLPDAKIYALAVFPATKPLTDRQPWYKEYKTYNKVIEECCEKYQVTFLDCTDIVKDEYYEPDGFHFKYNFYPIWLYHLAKGAGLL